jgi:hypothetical protein
MKSFHGYIIGGFHRIGTHDNIFFLENNVLKLFLVESGREYWVRQVYKRKDVNGVLYVSLLYYYIVVCATYYITILLYVPLLYILYGYHVVKGLCMLKQDAH